MAGDRLVSERRTRVLRGRWHQFPVSPSKFDIRLALFPNGLDAPGDGPGQRAAARETRMRWDAMARAAAHLEPAERLAWHRACVTLIAMLVDRFPFQSHPFGPRLLMEEAFQSYYAVPWQEAAIDPEVYVRDAVEFVVWREEDAPTYLLYAAIPDEQGDLVEAVLADMLSEIRRGGFTRVEQQLLREWAGFAVEHKRYRDFVPVAHAIGSSDIVAIQFLAEVASDVDVELALQVFAAANQPGPEQDRVVAECINYLDREPPPCPKDVRRI